MDTSPADLGYTIQPNIWVPLPDGRKLAARLWLPDAVERVPTVLEYLPYHKTFGTALEDDVNYHHLVKHGYAGIRVDIAGTGESDGFFDDEYSEDELSNAVSVIEWISAQPWSDGNVAMIGISWGGFNSLQVAMRRPPALKAIVSICASADRYADDIHYLGGCLLTDNFSWCAQMTSILTIPPAARLRPDWREIWLSRLRALPRLASSWLAHQRRGEYWRHGSFCEDWDSATAAILNIGGWADPYRNTSALISANYAGDSKSLVGPWEHSRPHRSRVGDKVEYTREVVRWLDRHLLGVENGIDAVAKYRAFVRTFHVGSEFGHRPGYWVSENHLPSPSVHPRRYGFHNNSLVLDVIGAGSTDMATSPVAALAAGNFCPGMSLVNELPGDQAETDAISLCFDTAPIKEDLEIMGQPRIELKLHSDQPLGQIVARLCEVAPDGRSMLVAFAPFNLTHHSSHETPAALVPGVQYNVGFNLGECAHRFTRGHRIRIALTNGYWPMVWPSPVNTRYTIDLTASSLILPERQGPGDLHAVSPLSALVDQDVERITPQTGHVRHSGLADGTCCFETWNDFGTVRNRKTGDIQHLTANRVQRLNPSSPESPEVENRWRRTLMVNDSVITTDVWHLQTSDKTHFRSEVEININLNGSLFFSDSWKEQTPRDHL